LQLTTSTTLNLIIGNVILLVQKVLSIRLLLLEGRDGQTWKDFVRNCAPCHFPNVDGQIDPSLAMVPTGL
jgi:hypothetical protein